MNSIPKNTFRSIQICIRADLITVSTVTVSLRELPMGGKKKYTKREAVSSGFSCQFTGVTPGGSAVKYSLLPHRRLFLINVPGLSHSRPILLKEIPQLLCFKNKRILCFGILSELQGTLVADSLLSNITMSPQVCLICIIQKTCATTFLEKNLRVKSQ